MNRIQEIQNKIALKEKLSKEEIEYYINIAQNDPQRLYEIGSIYYTGICVEQE